MKFLVKFENNHLKNCLFTAIMGPIFAIVFTVCSVCPCAIDSLKSDFSANLSESKKEQHSIGKTIKSGKNNVLTEYEKDYYQRKIGNDYRIISRRGESGYWATAYELENKSGDKFILKIPNNPSYTKSWIDRQRLAEYRIKKYYEKYQGDLQIPNYINIGDDFLIEEYLGKNISKKGFWNDLPEDEVSKFINSMAEFLKFTHSQERGAIAPLDLDHPSFALKDSLSYLDNAGALNREDRRLVLNLIEDFNHRDVSDEITCLTHNDIRLQNIVYNADTKKFALIDFDSLDINGKIYYGFTSKAMAVNGIPYEIHSKIIDKYNETSDFKINKEKVKMIHKVGSLLEITAYSKFKHKCKPHADIWPLATSVFDKFGEKIDNNMVCNEVWPTIKELFEEIDKGFDSQT